MTNAALIAPQKPCLSVRIGAGSVAGSVVVSGAEFFRFCFGGEATKSNHIAVALPQLGDQSSCEIWETDEPVATGTDGDLHFSETGSWLMLHLALDVVDDNICALTEAMYTRLLQETERRGFYDVVRAWNYMPDINRGEGDQENYRQFSIGRAIALEKRGYNLSALPAGTAIGSRTGTPLSITLLASKTSNSGPRLTGTDDAPLKNQRIENPRQLSAFDYPREYGPRSPFFSRAVLVEQNTLIVSGTASILGHKSVHDRELQNQAQETIANIEALCEAAQRCRAESNGTPQHGLLRIYVRNAEDADTVVASLGSLLTDTVDYVVLLGDICRSDLLLELEAVYTFSVP